MASSIIAGIGEISTFSQIEINSQCQCCVKLKSEVPNLKSELNSVKEIMKILKEDQDHLSKVVNIENTTVKSGNPILVLQLNLRTRKIIL